MSSSPKLTTTELKLIDAMKKNREAWQPSDEEEALAKSAIQKLNKIALGSGMEAIEAAATLLELAYGPPE